LFSTSIKMFFWISFSYLFISSSLLDGFRCLWTTINCLFYFKKIWKRN